MEINQLLNLSSGLEIFNLFFKTFSVVFSILYLLYSLVIYKQTQVMTRTLITKSNSLIQFFALLQILFGILLLTVSLFIV
ncbi:hypothetical protein A2774_04570 [Candidatus Roizmanbacteria bacterium RIFCSPHIGHO2_01_FULL_39_12c]|uniref:Uncharacterized protein n=1 Tax=Candidatus Roizmanbacteria bacterium RIFCSPHIGHO2_01_FULL_39_12c TaxID=1802031 RepID=A0A1F7GBD9_9BACT|nr:MAG: hypothetical protein A2774_04570 [Candidatus Roizmanbacteria bacterium RIFCSPHIGHO2_01_FULL_39_12c]OGK47884.1 MAG: hypothetical protein A2963_03465 [Candidatus Roizmanbacteria bacterium RIFCSPLOWO2_01_FULL_40_13]